MFHTTNMWKDNYKNMRFIPSKLLFKIFGKPGDKTEIDHILCELLERDYYNHQELSEFARELLAYMDHEYNFAPKTKTQSAREFATMIKNAVDSWIWKMFVTNVNNYLQHRNDRKQEVLKSSKDANKYSWKPEPTRFQVSSCVKDRYLYHYENRNKVANYNMVTLSNFLMMNYKPNKFLDDDFYFVLNRPKDLINAVEFNFYNTIFGFKKWTPWFSKLLKLADN